MKQGWLVLAGLALLGGCAPKAGGQGNPNTEGRYRLGDPGRGWERVEPGSADRAWHHAGISGALYADSNCGRRFEDGKLEALTTHLTFGVARGTPERSEPRTLDGRSALVQVISGEVDGVGVKVGSMVTKKNACLYDVLYVAPPATFEQGWPAFLALIEGFEASR